MSLKCAAGPCSLPHSQAETQTANKGQIYVTAAFFSFQRGGAIVERSHSDEIIFFLKMSNTLDAGSAEFFIGSANLSNFITFFRLILQLYIAQTVGLQTQFIVSPILCLWRTPTCYRHTPRRYIVNNCRYFMERNKVSSFGFVLNSPLQMIGAASLISFHQ